MTAWPRPELADRNARRVARLQVRTPDTTVRARVQMLVEQALRLTTLPGEDQGRIYVFRRVRLPALGLHDAPSLWIGRCSQHLMAMSRSAARACDPGAPSADAVFFDSVHQPWTSLALRLLAGEPADEWYWPAATGTSSALPVGTRLERLLDGWRELGGWEGIARELLPALDLETALALVERLPRPAAERWLAEFGGRPIAAAVSPAAPVRARVRDALRHVRLHVEAREPRLLFLAVLAVLDASPSLAQDASLPRVAAAVIADLVMRRPPRRDGRGHLVRTRMSADPASQPEGADRAGGPASMASPASAAVEKETAFDETEGAGGRSTEWAGLYFLLQPLRRLGIAGHIEAHPGLALERFASRVLVHLSELTGVALDDPVLDPLFDDLDCDRGSRQHQREASVRFRIPGRLERRRSTALWSRAVRIWCRRYARLTPAEVVTRPGRVFVTPTSIDVTMALSTVDLRIRRAGLDIDPGYLPWFGRAVHFHYCREG